jgi:outer membrane receptor for ferrienterochelin and colicin
VLKRQVGVAEGVPSDINIRGVPGALSATRILILVDGIPTNASGTPFLILNEIPLESIKKIEVIRGPFSCLYGANAFSGVINVITKTGIGRPNFTLYGDLGNMVFWQAGASSSGGGDKISYLVSGGARGISNYFVGDSALARSGENSRMIPIENRAYQDRRFFGKSVWFGKNKSVTMNVRYFESELGVGKTKQLAPDQQDIITGGQKYLIAPVFEWKLTDKISLELGSYYRQVKGSFYSEAISQRIKIDTINYSTVWTASVWDAVSNDWQFQAKSSMHLTRSHVITLGFENLWNKINFGATEDRHTRIPLMGSTPEKADIINSGIYFQDEFTPWSRLLLVPGVRFDHHSVFGWAVSPKVGAFFEVAVPLSLRASFGRGFRAPALSELFMPDVMVTDRATVVSNPELIPEYIWAGDAGFSYKPIERLTLKGNGFYNHMENLIVPRIYTIDTSLVARITFGNVKRARSYGFDSEIEFDIRRLLKMYINYTFTISEDEETKQGLDYIPIHQANSGLIIQKKMSGFKVTGSINQGFVGERSYLDWGGQPEILVINNLEKSKFRRIHLDHYFRTDLGFKCAFKKRIWTGFSVQNVFDAQFEEVGGHYAPGRLMSIQLGVNF